MLKAISTQVAAVQLNGQERKLAAAKLSIFENCLASFLTLDDFILRLHDMHLSITIKLNANSSRARLLPLLYKTGALTCSFSV